MEQQPWQFAGSAPDVYERYEVPTVHGPVATRLLEPVQLRPGKSVLDIACGTGIVARLACQIRWCRRCGETPHPLLAPAGSPPGLRAEKIWDGKRLRP